MLDAGWEAEVVSEDELREFGAWERSSWERRAHAYSASLGALTRGSAERLLRAARVETASRLLDVGTGPGFVALAATARQAQVTGVDQAVAMVRIARAAGVRTVQASGDALPFRGGQFDAVVAGYLLNHLAWPTAAVREFSRVLAPEGRLAFTVWDGPEANPVTGLFGQVVAELGLSAVVPSGPDPQRFADEGEVRRLLEGWREVSVEQLRWLVRVSPGPWFDAIADATPRAGAALAQATRERRAEARQRYIQVSTERYGDTDGSVLLPAGAVLVGATKASPLAG